MSEEKNDKINFINDFFHSMDQELKDRLETFCGQKKINVNTLSKEKFQEKPFYWMVTLLIKGDHYFIKFSIHYNTVKILGFTSLAYQKPNNDITNKMVEQFTCEYANLMAGHIQEIFNKNNVYLEIGIPWISRSFDQVFIEENKNHKVYQHFSSIQYENNIMNCSIEFHLLNKNLKFNNFKIPDKNDQILHFERF